MKKHKKARLLTMDDLRARPCEVDGVPALFHRWIDVDSAILKINVRTHPRTEATLVRGFKESGVCPAGCSVEVIRNILALVEYRDGTIDKVELERIRFTGEEGQHNEP